MPLYQVIAHNDLLTDDLRRRIAGEITRIHTTNTGAPAVFVNVLFQDLPASRLFTAGEPSRTSIIVGNIRAGRELAVRQAMLRDLAEMWTAQTGQSGGELLMSIQEVDPRASMEAGLIMPAPGEEDAWFEEHGDRLRELGLTAS
ncbi:MAG: cis-3-chloroacrylic acid dehalogenase [Mycobacterium sp.]|nr:cis-3-chloroacrylic acid dehalogenase [Mycobacterium sp.]